MAAPNIYGAYFESRLTNGATAAISGSFPVNYPHTWLRMRRVGNVLTGFAR